MDFQIVENAFDKSLHNMDGLLQFFNKSLNQFFAVRIFKNLSSFAGSTIEILNE
jgi:hypothetical protein